MSGCSRPHAVVVVGGDAPEAAVLDSVRDADLVIGVDSGAGHARRGGLRVDVVIGDLDSIEADDLALLRRDGAVVLAHPTDKDQTDLALAIDHAIAAGADRVTVVGGGTGDRFDHLLANVLLLASADYAAVRLDGWFGGAQVTVVRDSAELVGVPGEVVSLLAVSGPAVGVTTSGLRWPLSDATVEAGSSWGVSNEFVGGAAQVWVRRGVVLAVQPQRLRAR